jgi:ferredoxin
VSDLRGSGKVRNATADSTKEADPRPRRATVHDLTIEIDTDLCVGFGDCVDVAPEAFELDEDGIAFLTAPDSVDRDTLLDGCRSCPVDAIIARDGEGEVVAP